MKSTKIKDVQIKNSSIDEYLCLTYFHGVYLGAKYDPLTCFVPQVGDARPAGLGLCKTGLGLCKTGLGLCKTGLGFEKKTDPAHFRPNCTDPAHFLSLGENDSDMYS